MPIRVVFPFFGRAQEAPCTSVSLRFNDRQRGLKAKYTSIPPQSRRVNYLSDFYVTSIMCFSKFWIWNSLINYAYYSRAWFGMVNIVSYPYRLRFHTGYLNPHCNPHCNSYFFDSNSYCNPYWFSLTVMDYWLMGLGLNNRRLLMRTPNLTEQ